MKIEGICHCGKVGFEITQEPRWLTDCNCTICRRLGTLWGHIESDAFTQTGDGKTISYVHGDKTLAIHTCEVCGCTTHWENLHTDPQYTHMAVNFRMCEPEIISQYRIRKFDGFETWEFLD